MNTTSDVAKLVKLSLPTLQRWILSGGFKAPPVRVVANLKVRLWSKDDIERLKRFKAKHYREGQGKRTDLD
ncbi:MAG: helix-turn-helix domain-containing protein [Gammaproteobacteria bacterium]